LEDDHRSLSPTHQLVVTSSSTDSQELSTISLDDEHHESDLSPSPSSSRPLPRTVTDLALDSATAHIHQLEDELKKIAVDRQHWRALAKQVCGIFGSNYDNIKY